MKVLVHLPPCPLPNLDIKEAYKIVFSPHPQFLKFLIYKAFLSILSVCPGLIVTLPSLANDNPTLDHEVSEDKQGATSYKILPNSSYY